MQKIMLFIFKSNQRYLTISLMYLVLLAVVYYIGYPTNGTIAVVVLSIPFMILSLFGSKYSFYTKDLEEIHKVFTKIHNMSYGSKTDDAMKYFADIISGAQGGYAWDRFFLNKLYLQEHKLGFQMSVNYAISELKQFPVDTVLRFYNAIQARRQVLKNETDLVPDEAFQLLDDAEFKLQEVIKAYIPDLFVNENPLALGPYLETRFPYEWIVNKTATVEKLIALIKASTDIEVQAAFMSFLGLEPGLRIEVEKQIKELRGKKSS